MNGAGCCVFGDNKYKLVTFTTGKVAFGTWTQYLSKCGYNAHINKTLVKYITASFKINNNLKLCDVSQ